jgi:hypothetical protein
MLDQETVQQLQDAPVADRIQAIEVLLQSLKNDFTSVTRQKAAGKTFRVRTFDLGRDISVDRETMYLERSMG